MVHTKAREYSKPNMQGSHCNIYIVVLVNQIEG